MFWRFAAFSGSSVFSVAFAGMPWISTFLDDGILPHLGAGDNAGVFGEKTGVGNGWLS
jgi:hypothetical protein